MSRLSTNLIQGIYQGGGKKDGLCQVIRVNPLGAGKKEVDLSDGNNYLPFVIPDRVPGSDRVEVNSIIHLMDYTQNSTGDRRVIIQMEVRGPETGMIGDPQPILAPSSYVPPNQGFRNQYSNDRHPVQQQRNDYNNNDDDEELSVELATPFVGLRNGEDFVIHVRVIEKGAIRNWRKNDNEGSVATLELLDEDNRTIEAALFNEANEMFYEQIEVGQTYVMTGGRVKSASRFSRSSQQVTFGNSMRMKKVEDTGRIPHSSGANYTRLQRLATLDDNTIVDVCGVVERVEEPRTFNRRDGSESKKTDILLIGKGANDQSFLSVSITFWGDKLENDLRRLEKGKAIGIKNAKKRTYLGCTLSSFFKTQILELPNNEQTELLHWNRTERINQSEISLSTGRTCSGNMGSGPSSSRPYVEVVRLLEVVENNNTENSRVYCFVKGYITSIAAKSKEMWYTACMNQRQDNKTCQKKVEDDGHGGYHCGRCNTGSPNAMKRYMMNFRISDHSGVQWVTGFDDVGRTIFGQDAEQMSVWKIQDEQRYSLMVEQAIYKEFLFNCACEMRQDEGYEGLKVTINKIFPIDYARSSKKSLTFIKMYEQDD